MKNLFFKLVACLSCLVGAAFFVLFWVVLATFVFNKLILVSDEMEVKIILGTVMTALVASYFIVIEPVYNSMGRGLGFKQ